MILMACFCKVTRPAAEIGFACRCPKYITVMKVWVNLKNSKIRDETTWVGKSCSYILNKRL